MRLDLNTARHAAGASRSTVITCQARWPPAKAKTAKLGHPRPANQAAPAIPASAAA